MTTPLSRLREHTKKKESEIRNIVMEKLDLVGLSGDEETSSPARSPAVCANAPGWPARWCSTRRSSCATSPTPVWIRSVPPICRQLLIDINAQIDCTILIVTHNINIARTVPDNMGMLFRKHLVMFGPREVLLTSDEPVVKQFLNGRRIGPIGMSEEKDESTMAEEQALADAGHHDGGVEEIEGVPPQIQATPGMPERQGRGPSSGAGCARSCTRCRLRRRKPSATTSRARTSTPGPMRFRDVDTARHRSADDDAPTGRIPVTRER